MLDKRRGNPGHLIAIVLLFTVILLLWRHSGCPGPPIFSAEPPGYLIILPGNASALPAPYALHALPPDDKHRLIDSTQFKFALNNHLCNGSDNLIIVLIHSEPKNFEKRNAIRNTWGSQLKVLFLLGEPSDFTLQDRVSAENDIFHDIAQGNFVDTYRNMTYKHVMGLKWTTYYCHSARYVLKTDDDVFIHPAALLHYLRNSLSPHGARRLILCQTAKIRQVSRSYRSKWRVAYSEYSNNFYPPYCHGWAVLYSPDVVFRLYLESQFSSYFWIDDVFVTGLMATRANFAHSSLGDLVLSWQRVEELEKKSTISDFFIFGPPNLSVKDVFNLWRTVSSRNDSRKHS